MIGVCVKSAVVHILSVIIYYDPLGFLNYCNCCSVHIFGGYCFKNIIPSNSVNVDKGRNTESNTKGKKQNKKNKGEYFYHIMRVIDTTYICNKCTWPSQRIGVFGLCSLFTIDSSKLADKYVSRQYLKQLRKLLDCITRLVLYVNDFDECDEYGSISDDENEDENENESITMSAENSGSDRDENLNGNRDHERLLNVAIDDDKDVVNVNIVEQQNEHLQYSDADCDDDNLDYIQYCGESNKIAVPNTPLDYMNECVFFMDCVAKLHDGPNSFKKVLKDWDENMSNRQKHSLQKYVQDGKQGLLQREKRVKQFEDEKMKRKELSIKTMQEADDQTHQSSQEWNDK